MHPDDEECYWGHFVPSSTESAGASWKLTIPFGNRLIAAKPALEALLGPADNKFQAISDYWETNKQLNEASHIHLALDKVEDVEAMNTSYPRLFFDRLLVTKELAAACQGKVEISFSGYANDPREVFEIPEVRRYASLLAKALPELFFFHRTEKPTYGIMAIALCLTVNNWPDGRSTRQITRKVEVDLSGLVDFMNDQWIGLNRVTEWLEMSEEENKCIAIAAASCLGIPEDAGEDDAPQENPRK